jgi:hypothetical protein
VTTTAHVARHARGFASSFIEIFIARDRGTMSELIVRLMLLSTHAHLALSAERIFLPRSWMSQLAQSDFEMFKIPLGFVSDERISPFSRSTDCFPANFMCARNDEDDEAEEKNIKNFSISESRGKQIYYRFDSFFFL